MDITERFLRYVKIDTESKPDVDKIPSTEKQREFAQKLVDELKSIGLTDVTIDEHSYVMATLPANTDKKIPVVGFIAHMDTSPDFTGAGVKPRIIENYNGGTIVLNKEQNIEMNPDYFTDLKKYKGKTLITTDGTTLLGADDKAGVAEIVTAMEFLINHPEIKHGKIRIGFTPDEEVGKGADMFDVEKFGADYAYTVDGGELGELEYENFNAAGAVVTVQGKSVHPGYAKNKMVNAITVANKFISLFPEKEVPEHTEGYEGFYHIYQIEGGVDKTVLRYIIRDHDRELFEKRKEFFERKAEEINTLYNEEVISLELKDQYYNMREKIEPVMHIVDIAKEAMKKAGVTPIVKAIRGGTDGARLSYEGLPCPNIFTGGHNFHGRYEFIPVESMKKAVEVIVNIVELSGK
jgi:tripeptide aminopeptidase